MNPFFPVESRQLCLLDRQNDPLGDYRAVVNTDTNKCISVVSTKYRILPHQVVADRSRELINAMPELGQVTYEDRCWRGGRRFRRTYKLWDVKYEIRPGDLVSPEIKFDNSYDGTCSFAIDFGAYRLICSNGLVIGKEFFKIRQTHAGAESDEEWNDVRFTEILAELRGALEGWSQQADLWRRWSETPVRAETAEEEIERVFGAHLQVKAREKLWQDVEGGETLTKWILFNVLTYVTTHHAAKASQDRYNARIARLYRGS